MGLSESREKHAQRDGPPPPHHQIISRQFSHLSRGADKVPKETLIALLSPPEVPEFGRRLLGHDTTLRDMEALGLDDFRHAIETCLGIEHHTPIESRAEFFFDVFSNNRETIDRDTLQDMIHAALALALLALQLQLPAEARSEADQRFHVKRDDATVVSVVDSIWEEGAESDAIAKQRFCKWTSQTAPRLFGGVIKWIELKGLRPLEDAEEQETHVNLVTTPAIELITGPNDYTVLSLAQAFLVACMIPELYHAVPSWHLLYSSSKHGRSVNRFQHHVFNYKGPTVVSLMTDTGAVMCFAVDDEWREHPGAWGGPDCYVLSLLPRIQKFKKEVKVYANSKARHQEHGMGFGPGEPDTPDKASVWLDADLAKGKATFFPGAKPGETKEFSVREIEVWGCGDEKALTSQQKERLRDQRFAEERQKAKRMAAEEWQDSPDRQLLVMSGQLKLDEESRVSTRKEDQKRDS